MIKNKGLFISFITLLVFLSACKGEDVYFQKYVEIENEDWSEDNTQSFDFEIIDTTKTYNFFFNIRNTNEYKYRNLFVFWQLQSPDGRTKTDTAQFILAAPNGQWLGSSASGVLIENSMWFLKTKLPIKGIYSFSFTQGMREEKLENIKNVGLKIIKSNESE
jgi:gliding motility-associated lipoprotein GldH